MKWLGFPPCATAEIPTSAVKAFYIYISVQFIFIGLCLAQEAKGQEASSNNSSSSSIPSTSTLNITSVLDDIKNQSDPDPAPKIITVGKCCHLGKRVQIDVRSHKPNITCVPDADGGGYGYSATLSTLFADDAQEKGSLEINYEYKPLKCNFSKLTILTSSLDARATERAQIRLHESGQVKIRPSGNHEWGFPQKNRGDTIKVFCVDGLQDANFKAGETENQILAYCKPARNDTQGDPTRYNISVAHVVIMLICSIFLSLTVLSHVLVWNTQNIHGWTVASYCFSMLVFLIFKISSDIIRLQNNGSSSAMVSKVSTGACVTIGIIIHYFFIAMFSWMVVINFDMWSTIVSMTKPFGRREERTRFLGYVAFGFGIPLIAISISIFIEFNFGYFDDRVKRPLYGVFKCELDKTASIYHEIIASTILFVIGVSLSCFTVKFLLGYISKAKKLHEGIKSKQKRHSRNKVAQLLGKMFILLAFSWVFEVTGLLWSILSYSSKVKSSRYHVIIFDVHNGIQSLGFFWIFACKREMIQQLRDKYRIFEVAFSWMKIAHVQKSETMATNNSRDML